MKLKLTIAALLLSAPLMSYADGCSLDIGGIIKNDNVFSGPTTCSKATLNMLTVNGPLVIEKSTISTAVINGPAKITYSTLVHLTANGTLKLTNSTIDKLVLHGALEASDSSIFDIGVSSDNLTFKDSKLGNIVVSDSTISNPGKIYLKGYTTVSGDITFKGGKGIVYQDKTAKIMGKVTDGEIESEN